MSADVTPVLVAADLGHTVEFDAVAGERWTCTGCGRAVLRYGDVIYGTATEDHCTEATATANNQTGDHR